jgi:hypothetical protein
MVQRVAGAVCVVAGVLVLAGPGWALLVAGGLLWVRDARVEAWAAGRVAAVRRVWLAARRMPRRSLAASAMGAGLVLAPVGAVVSFGAGVALLVAAGLLLGFSLLTGQGA